MTSDPERVRFCLGCGHEVVDWNDGPPPTCCHCHEPVVTVEEAASLRPAP